MIKEGKKRFVAQMRETWGGKGRRRNKDGWEGEGRKRKVCVRWWCVGCVCLCVMERVELTRVEGKMTGGGMERSTRRWLTCSAKTVVPC